MKILGKDFYTYQIAFSALASGATSTASIKIEANSHFELLKMCEFSDIAGAAVTFNTRVIPLVNVLVTDSGSGKQLMDNPVPIDNIFGHGDLPFILPRPKIFVPNSTIIVQVTNFSAATAYNIKLSFIGNKIYTA